MFFPTNKGSPMQRSNRAELNMRSPVVEMLEPRALFSTATVATITPSAAKPELGQTVTMQVKVKTTKGKAVTKGTVELFADKIYLGVSAKVSSKGLATFTFSPANAIDVGTNSFYVHYVANSKYAAATSKKTTVTVVAPKTGTTATDGVFVSVVTPGAGTAVVAGDSVNFQDTGWNNNTGQIFTKSGDYKPDYGTIKVEANPEQTIPGLDQAFVGLKPGEVVDVFVPSAEAYNNGIAYVFVLKLLSING